MTVGLEKKYYNQIKNNSNACNILKPRLKMRERWVSS